MPSHTEHGQERTLLRMLSWRSILTKQASIRKKRGSRSLTMRGQYNTWMPLATMLKRFSKRRSRLTRVGSLTTLVIGKSLFVKDSPLIYSSQPERRSHILTPRIYGLGRKGLKGYTTSERLQRYKRTRSERKSKGQRLKMRKSV